LRPPASLLSQVNIAPGASGGFQGGGLVGGGYHGGLVEGVYDQVPSPLKSPEASVDLLPAQIGQGPEAFNEIQDWIKAKREEASRLQEARAAICAKFI
jgi:hypothetical protein